MPRVPLLFFLQVASVLGSSLTLVTLLRTHLYRQYRFFFFYFIYRIFLISGSLLLGHNSKAYFFLWFFSQPVSWVLYILVIRELVGLILSRYPGLKRLGRWFIYGSAAVSVAVSIVSILPTSNPTIAARSGVMAYVFALDRTVTVSVMMFLVVLLALLSRYPVRLSRNVVIHSYLFTIFFLSVSFTLLLRTLLGVEVYETTNTVVTAIAAGCTFAWAWLLSAKGEEVSVQAPHIGRGKEAHLLSQLDYLNQALLKTNKS